METKEKMKSANGFQLSAGLVIAICFIITLFIFMGVLGNPNNFQGGAYQGGLPGITESSSMWEYMKVRWFSLERSNPLPGNLLGTIFKGGIIVPVIQSLLLTVIVLSVERFFAIRKANGTGNLTQFVRNIKAALQSGDIAKAEQICALQKGSVANVVNSALIKYHEMENAKGLSKEQKLITIQKEIEEATALELPTLEQNLGVIATMTTLGTLLGLLGTVIGMIGAFAALATAGSPDSVKLSEGISEALVNTAFGIATAAAAVISYNYFTSKIDKITYCIDEVGFTIVQSYSATHE